MTGSPLRPGLRAFCAILLVLPLALAGCRPASAPKVVRTPPPAPQPTPTVTATAAPKPPELPPFDPNIYAPMSARCQDNRIPVIMYHDIVKERGPKSVWFDCTTAEFTKHLEFIKEHGIQPISLAALHEHLTRGKAVPEKAIVLTFDDNYQGFYDNAYPLLKQYNYPAAMFVHTNYVGDKTGDHPKMDWETLKTLDKEGLVTIGSHTLSHPDDMRLLLVEQQEKELRDSKQVLETHLGHPIPYLAYPNGKADNVTIGLAQRVGYTMSFTIRNGLAEESPDILAIHRYIHTRFEKAWERREETVAAAPAAITTVPLTASPVRLEVGTFAKVKLGLMRGGIPTTFRVKERQSVGEFVRDAKGVGGINGGFFADAKLVSTSNAMIGPFQTSSEKEFLPETTEWLYERLANRPIVVLGPTQFAIVPFQPGVTNSAESFRRLMPDFTDVFLAGGWIVHNGIARKADEWKTYVVGDAQDERPRSFLGITKEGEFVCGSCLQRASTAHLAEAAAAAGVVEAVLLDSGYSTSLVYGDRIIAAGHSSGRGLPSRPVPHAIVITGTAAPITDPAVKILLKEAGSAIPAKGELSADDPGRSSRRRRRRHKRTASVTPPATLVRG